jgi:predicted secreted hydrolase
VTLPKDDAPHNAAAYYEYWYWYGTVVAPDGRRFGVMMTFASKPWARVYNADISVSDLSSGRLHYDRQGVIFGRPRTRGNGFGLRGRHARAAGGDGHDRLQFEVGGYKVALALDATKPPTPQFGDGHVKAYCQSSHFYARNRMRVAGTMTRDGTSIPVTGTAHFVHQWGSPILEALAWNWLTLELADGRDIFVSQGALTHESHGLGSIHNGTISHPDGRLTRLYDHDFSIRPTRFWHRDAGCRYPVEWDLEIKGERFHARASIDTSELRSTRSPSYYALWPQLPQMWDGDAVVSGAASGRSWFNTGRYCAV